MNYSAKSYNRLYDSTLGPLWSLEEGLPLHEDGDHYSRARDFFEWWYFDASFDNGYRLVAILHSSLYNAVDHKPTIDVRLTASGKPSVLEIGRYSRSHYRAASEHCDVQIAGSRAATQDGSSYRLTIRQGNIAADLIYQSIAPAWRPGSGYLFADEATGHYFKWVVPVPAAKVSGTLWLNGEKMNVQGLGYHDHNWGNFVLSDAFSHWYWGRFMAESGGEVWAVVFGDVFGSGPKSARVRPFLLFGGGKILSDNPTITLKAEKTLLEPFTEVTYPSRLMLEAQSNGYRAGLHIEARQVLETVNFPSPPFQGRLPRQLAEIAFFLSQGKPLARSLISRLLGKGSYLRLAADARLEACFGQNVDLSGEAVYEVMYL